MVHCINTKSQDFIDLLQATKLKEPILRAKIGLWQQRNNNYDAYPTSEQILYPEIGNVIKEINFPNYRPDARIEEKYFSNSRVVKMSNVIESISTSSHPLNELAKHLLDFSSINNVNVVLDNMDSYQLDKIKASGYYDPSQNKIRIAKDGKIVNGSAETLILHEALHALSYAALRKDGIYTKAFRELYSYSVDKLGEYNVETKEGYYGNYTIDEFFVALFTDSKFIKKLQEIEPINKKEFNNLLQEVFDNILKLLKLDTNPSLYNQAFSVATNILSEEKQYVDDLESRMVEEADYISQIREEKPIKEGVADIFEKNPELVFIGTAQEYSNYLDTIFPDSKVKDIVYHGTKGEKFNKFKPSEKGEFGKGVYFGNYQTALQSTDKLDDFTLEPKKGFDKNKIIPAIINTQNTYIRDLGGIGTRNEYVVEPEQIHILGGEEDMRMFQEYMDFKNNVKDYFNLNEEESKFVQDNSNLNFNC
jgi:predicted 3-demethylubiquinone-9 3-methyltransferase (glyoxalase superfamily)